MHLCRRALRITLTLWTLGASVDCAFVAARMAPHAALTPAAATQDAPDDAFVGVVLDAAGNGVADATVRLNAVPVRETRSDAAGHFRLAYESDNANAEGLSLIAVKGASRAVGEAETGLFLVLRMGPETHLKLQVKDAETGKPIANAQVVLQDAEQRVFVTDAMGALSIDSPGAFHRMHITAAGYAPYHDRTNNDIWDTAAQVLLVRGIDASGRVIDADGRGVAKVLVFAERAQGPYGSPLGQSQAEPVLSDSQGTWTHHVLSKGLYRFFVQGAHQYRGATPYKRLGATQDSAPIDLVVTRAKPDQEDERPDADETGDEDVDDAQSGPLSDETLETAPRRDVLQGQAVDTRGRPVAGAEIYVHTDKAPRPDLTHLPNNIFGVVPETTADANGLFELPELPCGYTLLQAGWPDAGIVWPVQQDIVQVSDDMRSVRAVVREGGTVKGRVTFKDGQTPERLRIFEANSWVLREDSRGDSGAFVLQTYRPGPAALRFSGSDLVPRTIPVDVVSGGTTDLGTLVVERGVEATGRVVTSDGKPIENAEVSTPAALAAKQGALRTVDIRLVLTDAEGRFRLRGLDTNQLTATHPIHGVGILSIASTAKDVTIVLRAGGSVCGAARRPGGFPAVAALSIRQSDNTFVGTTDVRDAGRYCFEDLAAGTYCIEDTRTYLSACAIAIASGASCEAIHPRPEDAQCVKVGPGEDVQFDVEFSDQDTARTTHTQSH